MTMKIGYLEVVEVKKIRSRNVCQLIVEADIGQFKSLVGLDETKGVFIPCEISGAICGALDMDIDPKEIEQLMGITTKQTIEHKPEPEKKSKKKSLAQRMVVNGYFFNPKLWDAMELHGGYTQNDHLEFVRSLKPIIPYSRIPSQGDTVAHHVRTSENSGTGIKPKDWYTIPLADSQHQHLHKNETRQERADHLTMATETTAGQMRVMFKRFLKLETMTGFTDTQLLEAEAALCFSSGFVK
jgi:hypothetical protein